MDKEKYNCTTRDFYKNIKAFGYQKSSLVDYPSNLTSVLFLKYCNMSCHYCHNKDIMMKSNNEFTKEQLKSVIDDMTTAALTTGITISGGEPTLYGLDLALMLDYIKSNTNKRIKLDTNGTNPDVLEMLINEKLIDFIAMDIKSSLPNYNKFGYIGDINNIAKSINIIMDSKLPYQFRHTKSPLCDNYDNDFLSFFKNMKYQDIVERKELL